MITVRKFYDFNELNQPFYFQYNNSVIHNFLGIDILLL